MYPNISRAVLNNTVLFGNTTMDGNGTTHDSRYHHHVYTTAMFTILTIGLIGNLLTILVFVQKEHRSKLITPFLINLAVADIFIVMFGYPVAITANLSSQKLSIGTPRCTWSAFINGSVGIATIVILAEMSVMMCYTITSMVAPEKRKFSTKVKIFLIGIAWVYGFLSMTPPLFGWSRFVPGSARISCAPDWRSPSTKSLSYNIVLMIIGFVLPVIVIVTSYIKLYR